VEERRPVGHGHHLRTAQRQAELTQLMTNEQSRWTTLNAEIEALEKALTAMRPQR
jgi:uncharacterized protein YlxW (UPF0749 family)